MTEKPLLVLLHGWGSSAGVWQPIVDRLQDRYDCFVPELPGHGASEFNETRLESLAQQILESVNRPAIWLGWSLGALVATQAALSISSPVRQLLLVSATPAFVQQADWNSAMPITAFAEFQQGFANNPAKTLKRFNALQVFGDQQVKEVKPVLESATSTDSHNIHWGLKLLRETDLRAAMLDIQCQVNCLYGENDALVPASIQDAMRSMGANVTVWPDTGHAAFLSNPDKFTRWLRDAVTHA